MASPEFEQKKSFGERLWGYAVWGTFGIIALVATVNILSPQIATLEASLKLPH